MAQYISTSELAESFDDRMIKQLSSYSGTPQSSVSNSVVTNCIEKASAEVHSYALRGERYTSENLTALQTADDWSLKGLVATLTMKHLFRGKSADMPRDMEVMVGEATLTLEELREGKRVFDLASAHSAGKASIQIISATVRGLINNPSDLIYFPQRLTRKY